MNNSAIGVFDSGMGGLTCVKELHSLMPNENIIYFGDTARIPYGTRSRETIMKYAAQDIALMKKHDVKMIIAACGTVSSVVGMEKKDADGIPFTGVLLPTVQAACAKTRNGKVGVIGTSATIKSGSFAKAIRTIKPSISVVGAACPMFVPLVENGFSDRDNKVAQLVAAQYLEPLKREGVDTLILGCTHYPILHDVIADCMGEGVELISTGSEAAKFACAYLTRHDMLAERETDGEISFYSSDSTEMFRENAESFLGEKIKGSVTKVEMEELTSLA
ncbi:MAG: glutamate racemase [Oscillospiraceae bacterium]